MRTSEQTRLASALGVRVRELVSLVGGGGKSTALQLLMSEAQGDRLAKCTPGGASSLESAANGMVAPTRVVATTTTAMFLSQLQAVAPVLMVPARTALLETLSSALTTAAAVAMARGLAPEGKVEAFPVDWVDAVWSAGLVDQIVVEADGSRRLSLKAFGRHEPQIPESATLIVQLAGLDALGSPLDATSVHRPEILVEGLKADGQEVRMGAPISPGLFVAALRLQVRKLRTRWPAARIVTLLNKADDDETQSVGLRIAEDLLAAGSGGLSPEAVVVGSLQQRRLTRCAPAAPLVSAVVLAAGCSTRMGTQKLVLPVGGVPMVQRVVEAAMRSRAVETVVVRGADAGAVAQALGPHLSRSVVNPDYAAGMSTSLRAGIAAVRPDCDAAVILLGDQPLVTPGIIDQVIGRFEEGGVSLVRATADGKPTHPVVIGARHFPEIFTLDGDVGAREIIARHYSDVGVLELSHNHLAMDADTPEDYQTLSQVDPAAEDSGS
jgi:molybdenum cofactor cytidylyltransferase